MGFHRIADGEIYYDSAKVSGLPTHLISRKGIGYVPENQGIFHDLTVEETFALAREKVRSRRENRVDAGTISGFKAVLE